MDQRPAAIRLIDTLLRLASGALFLWAGAVKAANPAAFATDIEAYRLLPPALAAAVALYLPYLEILCGIALVARVLYAPALATMALLLVVFTAALASAWLRGLDIACGCFGHGQASAGLLWSILRNLALLLAVAILARRPPDHGRPGHLLEQTGGAPCASDSEAAPPSNNTSEPSDGRSVADQAHHSRT